MNLPTVFSSTDLELLHQQLEALRQAQSGRRRLPAAPDPVRFVECQWPPSPNSTASPGGRAELRDGSNRVLRLHNGRDPECWLALAEAFWRQAR